MHLLLWSGFNPTQETEIPQALQWDKENNGRNKTEKWTKQKLRCLRFSSVQWFSHVRLCDPMDLSTPGFPVHHQLLELAQTHVHWVGDAIQRSYPLLSPSPPALNLSQHQCLFKWVSSSHQVAKVLEFQLQHQSFQWTPRTGWTDLISLQFKGRSRVFSNSTVQKHQFFGAQLSL